MVLASIQASELWNPPFLLKKAVQGAYNPPFLLKKTIQGAYMNTTIRHVSSHAKG